MPFLIFLFFIPESPVYLIHTEKIETAHRVLRILRGPHWDITKELTDIKVASEGRDRERYKVTYRDFLSSTVLQPFLLALTLMFFFQFSGINVILQYTVDIFQSADSSVEEFQVLENYCSFSIFYCNFTNNVLRTIVFFPFYFFCHTNWFFGRIKNIFKKKKRTKIFFVKVGLNYLWIYTKNRKFIP